MVRAVQKRGAVVRYGVPGSFERFLGFEKMSSCKSVVRLTHMKREHDRSLSEVQGKFRLPIFCICKSTHILFVMDRQCTVLGINSQISNPYIQPVQLSDGPYPLHLSVPNRNVQEGINGCTFADLEVRTHIIKQYS
jgi:hypothetical protein